MPSVENYSNERLHENVGISNFGGAVVEDVRTVFEKLNGARIYIPMEKKKLELPRV